MAVPKVQELHRRLDVGNVILRDFSYSDNLNQLLFASSPNTIEPAFVSFSSDARFIIQRGTDRCSQSFFRKTFSPRLRQKKSIFFGFVQSIIFWGKTKTGKMILFKNPLMEMPYSDVCYKTINLKDSTYLIPYFIEFRWYDLLSTDIISEVNLKNNQIVSCVHSYYEWQNAICIKSQLRSKEYTEN